MYLLRENKQILRKYDNLNDAMNRFYDIIKNECKDDVELYELNEKDNLCKCLQFYSGNYFKIINDTSKIFNEYLLNYN